MTNTAIQILAGLGGAALTVYGLNALTTYVRYGDREDDNGEAPAMEEFMPRFEVDDVHRRRIRAPAQTSLMTACNLSMDESPLVRGIFGLRSIPSRLQGKYEGSWVSGPLLTVMESYGWRILNVSAGRHVVLGAVTQPWRANVEFVAVEAEDFRGFDEPGYAKIIWMLEATPVNMMESVLSVRTRVATTDRKSRRKFRRYWALVAPGSGLVRLEMLRLVKSVAEQGYVSQRLDVAQRRGAMASPGEELGRSEGRR